MSSLDICQPQTRSHEDSQVLGILDSHLPAGVPLPGFQPVPAARRNRLSTKPPTFPYIICQPWPPARGVIVQLLVALTAEYQKSAWKLSLLMCIINASLHGGFVTRQPGWGCGAEPFQKLEVTQFVDIDLSLIYLYREHVEFFSFTFFSLCGHPFISKWWCL